MVFGRLLYIFTHNYMRLISIMAGYFLIIFIPAITMFFAYKQGLIWQTENGENLASTFGFDLVKCHRESNAYGPQLIFVVSWLHCAFVARSRRITKCAKKRTGFAAHIFTEAAYLWSHGIHDVARVYPGFDARLSFRNLNHRNQV